MEEQHRTFLSIELECRHPESAVDLGHSKKAPEVRAVDKATSTGRAQNTSIFCDFFGFSPSEQELQGP